MDFDLSSTNDNVRAVAAGIVVYAGATTGGWKPPSGGYGNIVIIDHQSGYLSLDAHLSSITVSNNWSIFKLPQSNFYIGFKIIPWLMYNVL